MSPHLRGGSTTAKPSNDPYDLIDFIEEQEEVLVADKKLFLDALESQEKGKRQDACKKYAQLSIRYQSNVISSNVRMLSCK